MSLRILVVLALVACALSLVLFGSAEREAERRVPPAPASPAPPAVRVEPVQLRRGDTLVGALSREGVDRGIGADIAAALTGSGADLRRLRPRDALEITWNLRGEPIAVRWEPSPWLGFTVISAEAGWEVRRAETRPDVRVEAVRGEVARSLFEAIEAAGESAPLVLELVAIFASELDFTADTRAGDRFRLLVEKRHAGEIFVDYGRVLAAQYLSDGRLLTGVGFEGRTAGPAYYDLAGQSLRKSFLRSPLEFTRITSGFTYARPHPILGGVRPHLAVDYAAPTGTPVRAVADGRVTSAGWAGDNGLSVRVRHRAGYETMYNHLARLGPRVRPGVRVRQREVIGYVGSTGLSTGPHLDYRVARHGRFVNPLRETFVPGNPIPAGERAEFERQARAHLRRLEAEAPF